MVEAEISYRVPYADTDQMGVVYYANFFVYFERVRNELLRNMGLPYTTLEADGLMLPVASANCDYKIPAKYDDMLLIKASISEMKGCRMLVKNEVFNQNGDLLVVGGTTHCFVSAETRRPVKIPENVMTLFNDYKESK
ncbi:thioesterase family protein [Lentisphaera araneosa HTCC2155]|uniref:Thioesterase family protein n=1 Tax=Lentisphaera araneosa HTCC2155 TaxID=313628 RepID=A6DJZ1_9BACT|nr:thioesterase family protein [Lentisphaera araneosa]EDM28215.1 thioesterase family protein [Lentisphaera araneosa HTCC2155]